MKPLSPTEQSVWDAMRALIAEGFTPHASTVGDRLGRSEGWAAGYFKDLKAKGRIVRKGSNMHPVWVMIGLCGTPVAQSKPLKSVLGVAVAPRPSGDVADAKLSLMRRGDEVVTRSGLHYVNGRHELTDAQLLAYAEAARDRDLRCARYAKNVYLRAA
jgi:hypothetical protein